MSRLCPDSSCVTRRGSRAFSFWPHGPCDSALSGLPGCLTSGARRSMCARLLVASVPAIKTELSDSSQGARDIGPFSTAQGLGGRAQVARGASVHQGRQQLAHVRVVVVHERALFRAEQG